MCSGRRSMAFSLPSGGLAGLAWTIVASSKRSCGGDERVFRGETCRLSSAPGRQCSIASIDGRRRIAGSDYSRRYASAPTTNGTASTAQLTERTSTLPAEKGGPSPRDRTLPWRRDDEGPPRSRRPGSAASLSGHRGTAARHRRCARACARDEAAVPPRRQGI
jgi:hypothetical protein